MAGVTDLPFRLLCREQGAGLLCMEMVSAKAILYNNRNTEQLLTIHPDEKPVSLQLFGSTYSSYDHDLFLRFCKRFELNPKQKAGKLSKGQKTRLQLAFALSHQAKLFIMDEPASGLDPLFRRELTGYMQELVEDGTRSILFSTHLTADLDQIGDYIALIDDGHFLFCSDKESLRERFRLLEGSREEIEALRSPGILAKVHEEYGSMALAEYPGPELTGRLSSQAPTLAELLYYLQKGGCIR